MFLFLNFGCFKHWSNCYCIGMFLISIPYHLYISSKRNKQVWQQRLNAEKNLPACCSSKILLLGQFLFFWKFDHFDIITGIAWRIENFYFTYLLIRWTNAGETFLQCYFRSILKRLVLENFCFHVSINILIYLLLLLIFIENFVVHNYVGRYLGACINFMYCWFDVALIPDTTWLI